MAHSHFWLCLTFHYFRLLREVRLYIHPTNDRRVAELYMLPYKVLQSLRILDNYSQLTEPHLNPDKILLIVPSEVLNILDSST